MRISGSYNKWMDGWIQFWACPASDSYSPLQITIIKCMSVGNVFVGVTPWCRWSLKTNIFFFFGPLIGALLLRFKSRLHLHFLLGAWFPSCFSLGTTKKKKTKKKTTYECILARLYRYCAETQTLTYAGNTLHGDLSHALLEAGQARVDFPDLTLFPLDQLLDDLTKGVRGAIELFCGRDPWLSLPTWQILAPRLQKIATVSN